MAAVGGLRRFVAVFCQEARDFLTSYHSGLSPKLKCLPEEAEWVLL
jgi:hypothetical protein